MKKFFTLIAAALMVVSVNAASSSPVTKDIDFSSLVTDGVVTYGGTWQWKGITLSSGSLTQDTEAKTTDDKDVVYGDASAYDYLILEYSASTCEAKLIVQYNATGTIGQWGAEYNTGEATIEVSSTGNFTAVKLDAEKKATINAVALQNKGTDGTTAISKLYWATATEYEALKEATGTPNKDLTLSDLGSGWGNSTYDSTTHTITIGGDWSGKGWWLSDVDYSDYNYLTIEFDPATTANGKIVIEYVDGTNNGDEGAFDVATTSKTCALSTSKDHVKQIYIQGPAGSTYTLKAAYLSTTATGISSIKSEPAVDNDAYYNLSGQRVAKPSKGLYIHNGKKVIIK